MRHLSAGAQATTSPSRITATPPPRTEEGFEGRTCKRSALTATCAAGSPNRSPGSTLIRGVPTNCATASVRIAIERIRRGDLPQPAAQDDGDPVRHGHRLDLVVRHVDEGRAELAVKLRDLGAHVHAQLGVEVAERLVHQEDARAAAPWRGRAPRAASGRPRAAPACAPAGSRSAASRRPTAPRPRSTGGTARGAQAARQALHRREPAHAQRHGDVLGDRQVRIERVGLEHHRDVARGPAPGPSTGAPSIATLPALSVFEARR